MATGQEAWPIVTTYQFKVEDSEWDSWKRTVPRDKSLDTRIRELLKADREGRVLPPDHDGTTRSDQLHDVVDEVVEDQSVVDRISASWDDSDEKLEQRRAAAQAALDLAQERGQLGKSTAIDELLPKYAVDGQNDETWWRQNVREVLREVGTYSTSDAAFIVETDT